MEIKDRIFGLLKSTDVEMVRLGIILSLEQGRDWCIENLSYSGHLASRSNEKDIDKYALRGKFNIPWLNTRDLDRHLFIRHGVGILISGAHIHCRYLYQFYGGIMDKRMLIIVNFDNEPEDNANVKEL